LWWPISLIIDQIYNISSLDVLEKKARWRKSMAMISKRIIEDLDLVLAQWEEARQRSKYDDLSDLTDGTLPELVTTLSSAIERYATPKSAYMQRAREITAKYCPTAYHAAHQPLYGVVKSLRQAYYRGHLATVQELVHADLFSDFLEMAEHLLSQGYKDPAAVLIGGTLEEHLRKLSTKNGIPVKNASGGMRKASSLNDALAKVAYDKLQQKGVTYWLDLRNKAAHGNYGEYDQKDVHAMLQGVRDFINKFRA
jgi:hypothetical protein